MADSRYNQVPGYPGGPPIGPQGGGMQPHFIQSARPMNPMMQQQMMMPFAMQGMRMAPPNTPPPPYGAHVANPGMVNMSHRPRTTLSKSKGQPKSEKERFYEEQRQKLKQFGKPGAALVDTDSLIGAMFKPDPKPAHKAQHNAGTTMPGDDDDDGFGDFLQGPSVESNSMEPVNSLDNQPSSSPEPATLTVEEKKDLNSMMMECSDLSAPQKAKGFHKPTLNEVHHRHTGRKMSFHESDHSRSWKHAQDLDGLFQLPDQAPVVPVQAAMAYAGQAVPQGHMTRQAVPQGHMTGQAVPDGQMTGQAVPQGHMTGQVVPQGHMTGQAVPQGHMTGQALPQGHMTGQVVPQGHMTLQAIPQGHMTGQALPQGHMTGYAAAAVVHPGALTLVRPIGPPPTYSEALNHPTSPVGGITAPVYFSQEPHQNASHEAIPPSSGYQPQVSGYPPPRTSCPSLPAAQVGPQNPPPSHPEAGGALNFPDWCYADERNLPPVYEQVLHASLVEGQINTDRLYPILLLSGLPRERLAQIWSVCNTANPGQLIKAELWRVLALIALAQDNVDTTKLDVIAQCPMPPVPVLLPPQNGSHPAGMTAAFQNGHAPARSPGPAVPAPISGSHGAPQQQQPQPMSASQSPPQMPYQAASSPSLSLSSAAMSITSADDDFSDFQAAPSPSPSSQAAGPGKGHTSPSFEDDDFTDGRDSLSQISTSEQSENDDIRNFESYVEEFNHKARGAPTGSPLHCPFPSVQQANHLPKPEKGISIPPPSGQFFPGLPQPDQNGHRSRLETDSNTNSPIPGIKIPSIPGRLENSNSLSTHGPPPTSAATSEEFADFKSVQLTVPPPPPPGASAGPVSGSVASMSAVSASSDNFADFKTASVPPPPSSLNHSQQQQLRQTRENDKYGALRSFEDDDLMASSVFVSTALNSSLNATVESTTGEPKGSNLDDDDDEEWANFAEAPPASSGTELFSPSEPAKELSSCDASGITDSTSCQGQAASSSAKDDILKLFSASGMTLKGSSAMTSSITSEGSASMVNSDSGYSTKSSFFDTTPTSSGHPELEDKDGGPLWSQPITETTASEDKGDWANFGEHGADQSINSESSSRPTINVSSHEGGVSALGHFAPLHARSNIGGGQLFEKGATNTTTTVEEDWGKFSQLSTSSSSTLYPSENNVGSRLWSGASEDTGGDWASFPDASSEEGVAVTEVNADNALGAKFVTIKKQNLGTNEIMGVFKVRNDPATLSTYQLPAKPSPPTAPSRWRKTSTGRNRTLSDYDDNRVPPPMDSDGEDGDDDGYAFSRGYDLDDYMHRQQPVTSYSPFGTTNTSPYFSRAGKHLTTKVTGSNEDSGSVHSLELPSAKAYDSATGDSQSVSSSDFNSGLDPSAAEGGLWKSMDSLDLPSDQVDTNDEAEKEDTTSDTQSHGPIQPQELLASMPRLADKYNIDGKAQGNDRYRCEWEQCLRSCCEILTEANTLFNNISSSTVCNEVLKASQGSDYVSCVIEIYRVGCRIMTAMSSTAISSSELEQTLKQIDLVWNNLSAFLVGASLLPDQASLVFKDSVIKPDCGNLAQASSACGVCLLNVDYSPTSSSATPAVLLSSSTILSSLSKSESVSKGIASKLTFAGRQYHSTCANFWVNCVSQTLPSLGLAELL